MSTWLLAALLAAQTPADPPAEPFLPAPDWTAPAAPAPAPEAPPPAAEVEAPVPAAPAPAPPAAAKPRAAAPAAQTDPARASAGVAAAVVTGAATQAAAAAMSTVGSVMVTFFAGYVAVIVGMMGLIWTYPLSCYALSGACACWPAACAVPALFVNALFPTVVGGVGSLASFLGAPFSWFAAGLASGRRLPLGPLALAYLAPTWAGYAAGLAVDVLLTGAALAAVGGVFYYWWAWLGDRNPQRRAVIRDRMQYSGMAAAGLFVLGPVAAALIHLTGVSFGVVALGVLSQTMGRPTTPQEDFFNLDVSSVPPPPPPKAGPVGKSGKPAKPAQRRRPRPRVEEDDEED